MQKNTSKKIAYLSSSAEKTGVHRFSNDLINQLKLNSEVVLIKFNYHSGYLELHRNDTVKRIKKGWKKLGKTFFIFSLRKHIPQYPCYFIENQNLSFLKKKGILFVLDTFYTTHPKNWYERIQGKFLYSGISSYNKVLVCSHFTKKTLVKSFRLSEKKIQVFHLSYDKSLYQPKNVPSEKFYNLFPQLNHHDFFFHISTAEPRKNLHRIIKAFQKVSAKHDTLLMVFAGKINASTQLTLNQFIDKLNLTHKVLFLGMISDSDLVDLYNKATGFIFPSITEGYGYPALEAQACHCPTVTSQGNSLEEISGPLSYSCNPFSTQSIIDAMNQLLAHKVISKEQIIENETWLTQFSTQPLANHILDQIDLNANT